VEIIKPQFEELSRFVNGYAPAKQDGKWGFIDLTGEFVCPPKYDDIESYAFEGFPARVIVDNKKGYIDRSGNFIVKPEFEEIYLTKHGVFIAQKDKQWMHLGKNGERLNEQVYDSIDGATLWGSGYDIVYKNGKSGLVDSLGKPATSVIYDEIYEIFGDIFAKKDSRWGVLGKNDEWIIKPEFDIIYEFYNGLAIAQLYGAWGLLKKDGTWKIKNDYDELVFDGSNQIIASYQYKYGILDTLGNWIIKPEYNYISSYKNSVFVAWADDFSGLINIKGEWLCEFTYPYARHFSHDLFEYNNEDNYGLMDASGRVLRDYEFDELGYMWNGYAYFIENGKYGIIDSLGEIVYEAIAEEEPEIYLYDDFFLIKSGDYYGLTDKRGNFIIEPDKDYIYVNSAKSFLEYQQTTTDYWGDETTNYCITSLSGEIIECGTSYNLDYYREFIIKQDDYGEPIITNSNAVHIELFKNKYNYINGFEDSIAIVTDGTYYGAIMISDAQTLTKMYVENNINYWQKKGEFEKLSDYQARVTEETRQEKAKLFFNEIKTELISQFVDFYDWYDFTLSPYDAENESFLIEFKNLGTIILPIPVSEAKQFKENTSTCFGNNPVLEFDGKNFYLLSVELANYETETSYKYDATNSPNYSYSSMNYNFKPLDYNYQTNNTIINNYQKPITSTDPVDTDIPVAEIVSENTFAVVIGNENYKNEQQVIYAENDARIFKEYLTKTMGIPENHIHLVINATLGEILGEIEWLKKTAKAYEGEAKLVFYYAGHGMPEAETNEAYLLPCDGSSSNSKTGIKLSSLYSELSEFPTISTIVFLDACFSGASRDGMLASGRGTRITPIIDPVQGNMIILSAASGSQTANPYYEKSHGLFTYFLLSKLRETKGDVSFGELNDYIRTNVKRIAIEQNKEQEPAMICPEELRSDLLKRKIVE